MLKKIELSDETSCINKALPDEMVFVLLARDAAAPVAIEAWIAERIRLGLNQPGDQLLADATETAEWMRRQRRVVRIVLGKDPL